MTYINCVECGKDFSVGIGNSNYEGIVACPDCNTKMQVAITPDKIKVEPLNCSCDF